MKTKLLTIFCLLLLGETALQAQELKAFKDTKGLYGYKDTKGSVVIQPQYYHAYDFTQGLGAVQYEAAHSYRQWAYIDQSGKEVIPAKRYIAAYPFSSDGLAQIRVAGKYGWIDKSGKEVIPPTKYFEALPFSEGLAAVKLDGKWGFIDYTEKVVIPFEYVNVKPFRDGKAQVTKDRVKYFDIDKTGKEVKTSTQQKLDFTLPSNPDVSVQYSGEVKDGKANGYGEGNTFFKGNSDGTYKGYWKDNDYHGQGMRTWPSGDIYDGGFLNGKFHGKGTLTFGVNSQWKGDKYTGDWVGGQRTGEGTYIWANGDKYTGSWVNGLRTGYGKSTYINGKIEEGQWENNVFKGSINNGVSTNNNGKKQSGDDALTNPAFVGAMDNGDKYAENKQYDLAIQQYTKALQILPNFSVALYQRGYVYQQKGVQFEDKLQFQEADKLYHLAIDDYSEAIRSAPKDIEAYWARGNAYGLVGEYQKAVNDFTKMIELSKGDKKYIIAYKLRAMAYQELGQTDKATADERKYIEFGGKSTGISNNGNTQTAEKCLEQGNVHFNKKEYALAIQEYTKGIGANPKFTNLYFNRALAYTRLSTKYEDSKKAVEDLDKAIQLDPKNDGAYNIRGTIYMKWNETEKALEDMNKAIELKPTEPNRYKIRSIIYKSLNQPDKAAADMQKYKELGGK